MRAGRIVGLFELTESVISKTIFNMVSQRKVVEGALLGTFVIDLHVVVNCLFVGQVKVVLLVIGCAVRVTRYVLFFVFAVLSSNFCVQSSRCTTGSEGFWGA